MAHGLEEYAEMIRSESMDIADICEVNYVHDAVNHPFEDPVEFWEEFLHEHGFEL